MSTSRGASYRLSQAAEKLKAVYAARGWQVRTGASACDSTIETRMTASAFADLRLGHTDDVIEILEGMYETRVSRARVPVSQHGGCTGRTASMPPNPEHGSAAGKAPAQSRSDSRAPP